MKQISSISNVLYARYATNVGERKDQKLRKESNVLLVLEEATLFAGSA